MINEAFGWRTADRQKADGSGTYKIAYIDPTLSQGEDTFAVKDILKKYNFKWDGNNRYWYFILSSDPEKLQTQINSFIKPAVEELKAKENEPNGKTTDEEIENILAQIDGVIEAIHTENNPDASELEGKLEAFKKELINGFRTNNFRETMGPIIKFRQAQGAGFSMINSILAYLQRPNAKMIKSESKWKKRNRTVKPDARPIFLWCPNSRRKTYKEKLAAVKEVLAKLSEKNKKKYPSCEKLTSEYLNTLFGMMTPGEYENIENAINYGIPTGGFTLRDKFYEYDDTIQVEGTDDIIGNMDNFDNVEWFDADTPEDEKSQKLYDAIIETIKSFGIDVTYGNEESLGGARGVSKGGSIEVLENAPKNIGTVSTLVHELSHELLHQQYLQNKDEKFKEYFIGRPQGRAVVEQQAEISAWIVMRYFGYDMNTARNYAACWGADDAQAGIVFDTVAKVATFIMNKMSKFSGIVMESKSLNEINLSGEDVAKMLGPEAVEVYHKSKQQKVTNDFNSMLERINKADINVW